MEITIPNFIGWYESAKNSGLERDIANAIVSASINAWIAFTWSSGDSKWASIIGEGKALKDAATAAYVSLEELQKKGFLVLAPPKEMLSNDNISRFQVREVKK